VDVGVPVIVNVEVARALYETATVGRIIPRETFLAVAEIVMPYVSFGKSVGSNVASVAGGVPVPVASMTGGAGSRSW